MQMSEGLSEEYPAGSQGEYLSKFPSLALKNLNRFRIAVKSPDIVWSSG